MKTKIIAFESRFIIIAFLSISLTTSLCSQQVIKFKNGKQEKIFIVYQSKDTLKYYLPSESDVIRIVLKDQIDSIGPKALSVTPSWDATVGGYKKDRKCRHYQHVIKAGIAMACVGTATTIGGIVLIRSAKHTDNDLLGDTYKLSVEEGVSVTLIGGALLITGAILAISSSSKLKKYKEKMRGFSFDMKYTPQLKGICLRYQF